MSGSMPRLNFADAFWFQEGPGVRNTQFRSKGIKLLNVANITKDGQVDLTKTNRHLEEVEARGKYQHFLVDEGDLVIASSGISIDVDGLLRTRGAFIEAQHLPLCMNTSTIRFKAKQGVSSLAYLRHWLQSPDFRVQITRLVTGSAQKNFGPTHLKTLTIPLPPLEEQKRIAAILDQADELRRKRQRALDRLNQLGQAIFYEMFGDPISNLKDFPIRKLGDVGVLDRGISKHRPRNDPALLGGLYPLIQTGDVSNADGYIRSFTSTYSDLGLKQSRKWPIGTLCITIAANIGKTAILEIEACFPDSVVGFTPSLETNVTYVQFWMERIQKRLEEIAPQSAQKNINLAILRELPIPIPPCSLQNEFGAAIQTIEEHKAKLHASIIEASTLFTSLQHQAFLGEL